MGLDDLKCNKCESTFDSSCENPYGYVSPLVLKLENVKMRCEELKAQLAAEDYDFGEIDESMDELETFLDFLKTEGNKVAFNSENRVCIEKAIAHVDAFVDSIGSILVLAPSLCKLNKNYKN